MLLDKSNKKNFYLAFEDQYRGSRALIKERLRVYLPFVEPLLTVYSSCEALDIGCGRGEWIELLTDTGFSVSGVDLDKGMLEACHDLGLNAKEADGILYLRTLADESLAVISAFHVVEHIAFEQLQTLAAEAHRALMPGGLLIMETPNPENIIVATRNFYLDPTHERPIPPDLLSFVAEYAGFARVKILRLQESKELAIKENLSLLEVISGASPDYAIVAQKKSNTEVCEITEKAFNREYGLSLDNLIMRWDNNFNRIVERVTHAEAPAAQVNERATHAEAEAAQANERAAHAEAEAAQANERAAHAEAEAAQAYERATHAEAEAAQAYERAAHAEAEAAQAYERAAHSDAQVVLANERLEHAKTYAQSQALLAEERWMGMMAKELATSMQLERKIEDLRQSVNDFETKNRKLQTELGGILASRSWWVTKPIRLINKWLQNLLYKKSYYQNIVFSDMKNGFLRWNGIVLRWLDEKILRKTQVRSIINRWLFLRFPALHYKIRKSIKISTSKQKNETPKVSIEQIMPAESELDMRRNQVLSDPKLIGFERPIQNVDAYRINSTKKTVERLIPVHDLNEVRQSPTSVCFVLTVDNNSEAQLCRTLNSILSQTDPAWEIILCNSGEYDEIVSSWLDIDWRIRRIFPGKHQNIASQLIEAAACAFAEYIGNISQGDFVDCDLVRLIGNSCNDRYKPDLIYTDQIKVQDDGKKDDQPWFKPDWSPEQMYSVNFPGRFLAIKKTLVLNYAKLSGNVSNQSAQYWLSLKASSDSKSIHHIDEGLYFSTREDTSSVGGFFSTDVLIEAAKILESHIESKNKIATVREGIIKGSLYVDWHIPEGVEVTLLILTGMFRRKIAGRGEVVLAENFVKSIIEKTIGKNYKILVVHDGNISHAFKALLDENNHSSVLYQSEGSFSFAHKANFAVSLVKSGVVILLNDDLEVINPDWIRALVGQAARPEIGVVGGRLLFEDNTIQHAGLVLGVHGTAGHIFHRVSSDLKEYAGYASITRNYSAVTGAVMAFRKDVFDAVGGFDEMFRTDYNDVDFCLRCINHGYRNVYNPMATLYHFHNSSFKRMHDDKAERLAFLQRWGSSVERDPFYSKHFQMESSDLPLLMN